MKDPAFLFYPGDWMLGTMHMTILEKGAYFELLMLQFTRGSFTMHMAQHMLSICFGEVWSTIKEKFKTDGVNFWNERLREEQEKRKRYTDSRKNNALIKNKAKNAEVFNEHMHEHMHEHMENENENENKDINKDKDTIKDTVPHQQIIDLYHTMLPELSRIKKWTPTRKAHLKQRWHEDKKRQSIEYWERLFTHIKNSEFLMGRSNGFRLDLPWLIKNEENFLQVIEDKYHHKGAQQ